MSSTIPKYYLYKRLVDSKIYIDLHFAEPLDLEELARVSCFSKYHYIKLFKEAYGMTPIQYLKKRRFARAIALMKSPRSMSQICNDVGYTSLQTFTNEFRKMIGMNPRLYRKKYYFPASEETEVPQCFMDRSKNRNSR